MNLYDLDTPALIVDLDRLEQNIARAAEIARRGGKALRPHTKTHKTPEIAALQVRAGASGLTVAKLGEAEVFADAGFPDIFIANEIVGPIKLQRLIELAPRCRVTIGVDSVEAAEPISRAAQAAGLRIRALIEIDTGHGRAGVRTVKAAVDLARRLHELKGIEPIGIFTHEGAVSKASQAQRPAACNSAAEQMRDVKSALLNEGLPENVVSVGSTPGLERMAAEPDITELRPGTYVFGDTMQAGLESTLEDCALTVLSTVVSRPAPQTAIVDAGTKSLSGDRAAEGSKHGLVVDHPDVLFDWANEEHGHLDLTSASWQPRVGDKVRIIPYHACTATNMHDELYAVRGERVEAVWKIAARGKIR